MSTRVQSKEMASNQIKMLLTQKEVSYSELVKRLRKIGVRETYASITNKISRGTFSFSFYLLCLRAIDAVPAIPTAGRMVAHSPEIDLRHVSHAATSRATKKLTGSGRGLAKTSTKRTLRVLHGGKGYSDGPKAFLKRIHADARQIPIPDRSVDLIVTSPPYWKKRDYSFDGQLGQERDPGAYVGALVDCLREWRRVLSPWGSVFINVGDSYDDRRSLAAVPSRLETAAIADGWLLRNRVIWAKEGGMPDPVKNRLVNRHEHILHLVNGPDYYYDMFGYSEKFGNGSNPGDVWTIGLRRNMGGHLAPYPEELVERAIILACPTEVCTVCSKPRTRIVERTTELDPARPQARRAMELAKENGLTAQHIAAIQATGISDAGKALRVQTGTGKNTEEVRRLAGEAKAVLGGYFREFTFPKKRTAGWTQCPCKAPFRRGLVLDPFMGTGTTLTVANSLGRNSVGIDLAPQTDLDVWGAKLNGRGAKIAPVSG